ncbi:hypothetical protein FQR65_LT20253 [Abscondita terminalis]|nr:hypothetical protein FQR65_LT20253 [Abscondita terminalis]
MTAPLAGCHTSAWRGAGAVRHPLPGFSGMMIAADVLKAPGVGKLVHSLRPPPTHPDWAACSGCSSSSGRSSSGRPRASPAARHPPTIRGRCPCVPPVDPVRDLFRLPGITSGADWALKRDGHTGAVEPRPVVQGSPPGTQTGRTHCPDLAQ